MDPSTCTTDEQLDLEYLKILRLMKPYITCIMNNDYVQLIRLWLEKLSSRDFRNKMERNKYLQELGKQIEDGILDLPFVHEPPDGQLPPYYIFLHKQEEFKQKDSIKEIKSAPYYNPKKIVDLPKKHTTSEPINLKNIERSYNQKCEIIKEKLDRIEKYSQDIQNPFKSPIEKDDKKRKIPKKNLGKYSIQEVNATNLTDDYSQYMIERYKELNRMKSKQRPNDTDDDSSWLDLTEISNTNVTEWGSGDRESDERKYLAANIYRLKDFYELKITNLLSIIEEIKEENILLKQGLDDKDKELQMKSSKADTSINHLNGEITTLKTRLQELMDVKLALQSSHYTVATEWHQHMNQLEKKMHALEKENTELQMTVSVLDKKLNMSIITKNKKAMSLRKKMSDLHDKETSLLKELNMKTEMHFKNQLLQQNQEKEKEIEEKIKTILENYENKLSEMEKEFKDELEKREKENEKLQQLTNELQDKIKRKEEQMNNVKTENGADKITYLQKCVIKMDKLYHKAEKEYLRQISKLKKEIDNKDRTLQAHLSAQKVELVGQSSRLRQIEIDSVVNKLEEHYKLILRQQQSEAITAKEEYEKQILILKEDLNLYRFRHTQPM